MSVAAIILAAGASRRLGRPKQLIEYKGETLIARVVRIAQAAGLTPLMVVIGAEREAVRSAIRTGGVTFVENDAWPEGIASSMRAGLKALDEIAPDSAGVMIMPCDQPRLRADHLSRMVGLFAEGSIVASTYAGVRGVPAVFPRDAWSELMALSGDAGARRLLINPARPVVEVAFDGGEIDIDAPEDLDHLH